MIDAWDLDRARYIVTAAERIRGHESEYYEMDPDLEWLARAVLDLAAERDKLRAALGEALERIESLTSRTRDHAEYLDEVRKAFGL